MSNPFDINNVYDDDNSAILEGFLCPVCKQDLKTPERLTSHVETLHSDEQDLLQSLKDIFSKAKKKIFDDSIDLAKNFDQSLKPNFLQTSQLQRQYNVIQQTIGAHCDHISYFKAIRTPRLERYATETNKLIIRLHKLLKDLPIDKNLRRSHEQLIVSWLDGKSVNLCPNCAKSFHLARRQHHCRLCGSIMCDDCSNFLPKNDAVNLVNPVIQLDNPPESSSEQSQQSETTQNKDYPPFRLCEHCLHLLNNRKEMQDSRTHRPPISEIYDKIQTIKKEILPEIPTYLKIINSLFEGDSIFTLNDAGALREKIGRTAERIDSLSKTLSVLPTPQGSREEALKRAIRADSIRFIKEDMLSIPPLPLEEEIKRIRDKRRQENEMRIERERRLATEAYEKYELSGMVRNNNFNSTNNHRTSIINNHDNSASGSALNTLDNWSGQQITANKSSNSVTDPLIEQINIIKGYIKQARQALRFEEVSILEMNLRELQQEFYEQQQQRISSSS